MARNRHVSVGSGEDGRQRGRARTPRPLNTSQPDHVRLPPKVRNVDPTEIRAWSRPVYLLTSDPDFGRP